MDKNNEENRLTISVKIEVKLPQLPHNVQPPKTRMLFLRYLISIWIALAPQLDSLTPLSPTILPDSTNLPANIAKV